MIQPVINFFRQPILDSKYSHKFFFNAFIPFLLLASSAYHIGQFVCTQIDLDKAKHLQIDLDSPNVWIMSAVKDAHQDICVGIPNKQFTCFSFGPKSLMVFGEIAEKTTFEPLDSSRVVISNAMPISNPSHISHVEGLIRKIGKQYNGERFSLSNQNCRTFAQTSFQVSRSYLGLF